MEKSPRSAGAATSIGRNFRRTCSSAYSVRWRSQTYCSGAVCKSWHDHYSSTRRLGLCSKHQGPCLMSTSPSGVATLHRLSTGKLYRIPLPDMPPSADTIFGNPYHHPLPGGAPLRDRYVVGSSQGWLVTADELSELHLLNPITGAQFPLPPLRYLAPICLLYFVTIFLYPLSVVFIPIRFINSLAQQDRLFLSPPNKENNLTKVVPAKYIMKTDDDAFVRIDEVISSLKKSDPHGLLYGLISFQSSPHRNKDSKWFISPKEWPVEAYPPWAHGPGYIVSRDIAKFIVHGHEERTLQLFKLEDVAMGIWIQQYKNSGQKVNYVNDDRFYSEGCDSDYVLAHYQSPRLMMCLWEKLQKEYQPVCCE